MIQYGWAWKHYIKWNKPYQKDRYYMKYYMITYMRYLEVKFIETGHTIVIISDWAAIVVRE